MVLMGCEYTVERPDNPFLDAAFRGNVRELEKIVEEGEGAEEKNSILCRRFGRCPEDKPVDVTVTDHETGKNALHYAAYQDNRRAISFLISAKVPLEHQDKDGLTPLFDGLVHKDALTLLLKAGAKVTVNSDVYGSPLNFAIERGANPDRFEQLIKAGAKAEKDLICEITSYSAGKWEPEEFSRLIVLLVKAGAKLDWQIPETIPKSKKEKREKEKLTVDDKKYLDDGKTALHIAVLNRDFFKVTALLDAGANPRIKDSNGDSPQSLARYLVEINEKEFRARLDREEKKLAKEILNDSQKVLKVLSHSSL